MIPQHDNYTGTPVERDFGLKSFDTWKTIDGAGENITELDAIAQTIYSILRTERYNYPIYSGKYGLYTADLIGQPKRYILAVLKERITEALLMDNRITAIDGFYIDTFRSKGHVLSIGYTIHTVVGDLKGSEELYV